MKARTERMKNNLGLVCITTTDEVRYKTVTRKRLLSFDTDEQARILRNLYTENASRLEKAIEFCLANEIRLYRMTSDLFPFSDDPFGFDILTEFAADLRRIGQKAIDDGLRLVLHPDQYVVLSSDSDAVISNSIKILQMHSSQMDMLNQPQTEWAAMTIHGGKSDRADRLLTTIAGLPDGIRNRIVLENDEYSYSSDEILDVCRRAGVPMIFDAHHHVCHEKLDSFDHPSVDAVFWAAQKTWANPANQMVHISNGRTDFNDRAHHDLIIDMPAVFRHAPWIEVEAKHKELAIRKIRDEWN